MLLEPPTSRYCVKWDEEEANTKTVLYSWTLVVRDILATPTSFLVDLVHGMSPLIYGLNQRRFSDTINTKSPSLLLLPELHYKKEKVLYTYIRQSKSRNDRLCLNLPQYHTTTQTSLFAKKGKHVKLISVENVYRYTHASPSKMKNVLIVQNLEVKLPDNNTK